MRSLLKAATYLLYCNPAASLVLPSSVVEKPAKAADSILEYVLSSTAQLKFRLDNVVTTEWPASILELEIGSTDKLCAETNIILNGEPLATRWEGTQGHGEAKLQAFADAPATWTVTCLWDSSAAIEGDLPASHEIIHLLTLRVKGKDSHTTKPAFTTSYKSFRQPSILRFEPHYYEPTTSNADFPEWRTANFPFATNSVPATSPQAVNPPPKSTPESPWPASTKVQQILGAKLQDTAKTVLDHLKHVVDKYCPKHAKIVEAPEPTTHMGHHQNETRATLPDPDEDKAASDALNGLRIPSMVESHAAAETRSLHPAGASLPLPNDLSTQNKFPYNLVIHLIFLLLVLGSIASWLVIRWRDPRRRAERAARREERKNRRLYKCAARRQKLKTMIWSFRVRWGLAPSDAMRYGEKQCRVAEQDAVLEEAVKDEIRGLREAHRAITSLMNPLSSSQQVEEGRSGYVYEEDGYGRRRLRSTRSVATLPEYQSEGSRPPSYRSRRGSGTDFNSDSSVVSTSPRISRDGTSSDLDEKIEELDLREGRPLDFRPRA